MHETVESDHERLPSRDPDMAVCIRIDHAMRMIGIGKTKLYELIATGELETIQIGRRRLVLRTSIESMIERLRHPTDEDPDSVS